MRTKTLSPKEVKWAHKQYMKGYSYEAIAVALCVGKQTIYREFKDLPKRENYRRISKSKQMKKLEYKF